MIDTGNDVNKITLIGNLANDLVIQNNTNGDPVIGFAILMTTAKQNEIYVSDRHSVVIKGEALDNIKDSILKGSRVKVMGVLRYRKRKDVKYPSAEIHAESFELVE